jgi:hypothetical protein
MATSATLMPLSRPAPAAPAPEPEPCGLESLIRPNFFAGQLLTDKDLMALLTWVKRHRGLDRYRDGWGVVCGLDVAPDGSKPGGVVVGPGYAVGPCGGDLLVPEAKPHSFDDVCQGGDPCAGTAPPDAQAKLPDVDFGGITVPARDVRVVRLSLKGKPSPMQPQPALNRNPTGPNGSACQPARVKECAELVHTPLDLGGILNPPTTSKPPAPPPTLLDAFKSAFGGLYAKDPTVQSTGGTPAAPPDPAAVRAWFQGRLAQPATSAHRFPAVSAMLDRLSDDEVVTKWKLVPLLFWMLLDDRLAARVRPCATTTERCVPLARVWLWHKPAGCVVLRIDLDPPYRRPYGPDCPPPPLPVSDLTPFLWQPWPRVSDTLKACDVTEDGPEAVAPPASPEELHTLLDDFPSGGPAAGGQQVRTTAPSDHVVTQTWLDPIGRVPRVVGFHAPGAVQPAPAAAIASLSWAPAVAGFTGVALKPPFPPNSQVKLTMTLTNTSGTALTYAPFLHAAGKVQALAAVSAADAVSPHTIPEFTLTLPPVPAADPYARLSVLVSAGGPNFRATSLADGSDEVPVRDVAADCVVELTIPKDQTTVAPGEKFPATVRCKGAAQHFQLTNPAVPEFTLTGGQSKDLTVIAPDPVPVAGYKPAVEGTVTDVFGRAVTPRPPDGVPSYSTLQPLAVQLAVTAGGAVAVNSDTTYTVTLTNGASATLTVQSIAVVYQRDKSTPALTGDLAAASATVANGATKSCTFTFHPADADKGKQTFVLTVKFAVTGEKSPHEVQRSVDVTVPG